MRWSIKLENGRWHVNCMRDASHRFYTIAQYVTKWQKHCTISMGGWRNMVSNEMHLNGVNTINTAVARNFCRLSDFVGPVLFSIREYRLFDNILNCVRTTKLHSKGKSFFSNWTRHTFTDTNTNTHAQPNGWFPLWLFWSIVNSDIARQARTHTHIKQVVNISSFLCLRVSLVKIEFHHRFWSNSIHFFARCRFLRKSSALKHFRLNRKAKAETLYFVYA